MAARDTAWPEGTPCWVDLGVADVPEASAFYSKLFGWDVQAGPPETGGYSMCHLNGRAVAGIGPKMGPAGAPTMWMTHLAVTDADATAAKIEDAGGQLLVEPMDVMDLGRTVVATDAAGAVFGLWQARAFPGAMTVNEPGAMTWNEQMSHDFEGSKTFYASVLGCEFADMSAGGFSYAAIKVDGREVGGVGAYPADVPAGTPASWSVYFGTADTDASMAAAQGEGGSVVRPAMDSTYGRMGAVADSQGATFSLISITAG